MSHAPGTPGTTSSPHPVSAILAPGTLAPAFALEQAPGERLALASLRGAPVILAFYPGDWSPVCGDQMVLYNEVLPEFEALGARLLGISVDSAWCHGAYRDAKRLRFPLLADFEPKGAVSRLYGAYDDVEGESRRALFVLDRDGIVRWSHLAAPGVNPGADGILAALEGLPAQPTLPALPA